MYKSRSTLTFSTVADRRESKRQNETRDRQKKEIERGRGRLRQTEREKETETNAARDFENLTFVCCMCCVCRKKLSESLLFMKNSSFYIQA
jgi:hypothetical protein